MRKEVLRSRDRHLEFGRDPVHSSHGQSALRLGEHTESEADRAGVQVPHSVLHIKGLRELARPRPRRESVQATQAASDQAEPLDQNKQPHLLLHVQESAQ